jgi:hypothetical protein
VKHSTEGRQKSVFVTKTKRVTFTTLKRTIQRIWEGMQEEEGDG